MVQFRYSHTTDNIDYYIIRPTLLHALCNATQEAKNIASYVLLAPVELLYMKYFYMMHVMYMYAYHHIHHYDNEVFT